MSAAAGAPGLFACQIGKNLGCQVIGIALTAQLQQWVDEGKPHTPFQISQGIENTLVAYRQLLTGDNIGKVLVQLD